MPMSKPPLAFAWTAPPVRAQELPVALRERVAGLTRTLRGAHDDYERAAQSWTPEAAEKKRDARKVREETIREIENLLAREVGGELLAGLQRQPFARKLVELETLVAGPPAILEVPPALSEARRVATPAPVASQESAPASEPADVGAAASPAQQPASEPEPRAVFATAVDESEATASTAEGPASEPALTTVVASGVVSVSTVAVTAVNESPAETASPAPSPSPAVVEAVDVVRSNLPVLPVASYRRRRSIVASMTARPFGMGVALIVLVLAILGGWQILR
jgi:hypothetical protein